eukprot:s101_g7.t1
MFGPIQNLQHKHKAKLPNLTPKRFSILAISSSAQKESTDEDDRDHWTQVSIVPNATWWNGIHGLSNRHYGIAPCRGCQSSKPSHAQRAKIPHCSNKRCARRDDVDPLVLPARREHAM